MLLTVGNHVAAKSTLELFALARKAPGTLNYASSGQGSTNHFATELLMDAAQIKMIIDGQELPKIVPPPKPDDGVQQVLKPEPGRPGLAKGERPAPA